MNSFDTFFISLRGGAVVASKNDGQELSASKIAEGIIFVIHAGQDELRSLRSNRNRLDVFRQCNAKG